MSKLVIEIEVATLIDPRMKNLPVLPRKKKKKLKKEFSKKIVKVLKELMENE